MAPLIKEFQKLPDSFDTKVCITIKHREMLDQMLDLMKSNQNLYTLTVVIIDFCWAIRSLEVLNFCGV